VLKLILKTLIQQASRCLLNIPPYKSSLWLPWTPLTTSTVVLPWRRQILPTHRQILLTAAWPMGFRGSLTHTNAISTQVSAGLHPLSL